AMNGRATPQPAILDGVPSLARYLVLDVRVGQDPRPGLSHLKEAFRPDHGVVGVGQSLALLLAERGIAGLRSFTGLSGRGVSFPSNQGAVWAFLRAEEASELHDRARTILDALGDA